LSNEQKGGNLLKQWYEQMEAVTRQVGQVILGKE